MNLDSCGNRSAHTQSAARAAPGPRRVNAQRSIQEDAVTNVEGKEGRGRLVEAGDTMLDRRSQGRLYDFRRREGSIFEVRPSKVVAADVVGDFTRCAAHDMVRLMIAAEIGF